MDLYISNNMRRSLEMTSDVEFDISSNLSHGWLVIFVDDS